MRQLILRILLGLVLIQVLTYVFLSEMMLERKACDKYIEFTERRFANPYNKNVSESIHVSSCGDEFFRDMTRFVDAARSSNPDYPAEVIDSWDSFGDDDFNQSFQIRPYPQIDILGTIRANTDTLESSNCILFELCSRMSIPCFFKQVEYLYYYSSFPTDFHIMQYTDRAVGCRSNYVWVLFFWVEFNGEIVDTVG